MTAEELKSKSWEVVLDYDDNSNKIYGRVLTLTDALEAVNQAREEAMQSCINEVGSFRFFGANSCTGEQAQHITISALTSLKERV